MIVIVVVIVVVIGVVIGVVHVLVVDTGVVEQWPPIPTAMATSSHALRRDVQVAKALDLRDLAASVLRRRPLARAEEVTAEDMTEAGGRQPVIAWGLRLHQRGAVLADLARRTDAEIAREQPVGEKCDLSALDERDVGAELGQVSVGLNHGLPEDLTHGDGSGVVRNHPANEIDGGITTELDGHGLAHLVVCLQELHRGGAREIAATHHHVLHAVIHVALVASQPPQISADFAGSAADLVDNGVAHCAGNRRAARALLHHVRTTALTSVLTHRAVRDGVSGDFLTIAWVRVHVTLM
mmetsp:Transcript_52992/g.147560  ORF Transcript_52992/g.147560 Transcript_52992/m.147560 type:complete len:296 (-) Transcript_52992:1358-2245(-)